MTKQILLHVRAMLILMASRWLLYSFRQNAAATSYNNTRTNHQRLSSQRKVALLQYQMSQLQYLPRKTQIILSCDSCSSNYRVFIYIHKLHLRRSLCYNTPYLLYIQNGHNYSIKRHFGYIKKCRQDDFGSYLNRKYLSQLVF